jgi:hypothetical protein
MEVAISAKTVQKLMINVCGVDFYHQKNSLLT